MLQFKHNNYGEIQWSRKGKSNKSPIRNPIWEYLGNMGNRRNFPKYTHGMLFGKKNSSELKWRPFPPKKTQCLSLPLLTTEMPQKLISLSPVIVFGNSCVCVPETENPLKSPLTLFNKEKIAFIREQSAIPVSLLKPPGVVILIARLDNFLGNKVVKINKNENNLGKIHDAINGFSYC